MSKSYINHYRIITQHSIIHLKLNHSSNLWFFTQCLIIHSTFNFWLNIITSLIYHSLFSRSNLLHHSSFLHSSFIQIFQCYFITHVIFLCASPMVFGGLQSFVNDLHHLSNGLHLQPPRSWKPSSAPKVSSGSPNTSNSTLPNSSKFRIHNSQCFNVLHFPLRYHEGLDWEPLAIEVGNPWCLELKILSG